MPLSLEWQKKIKDNFEKMANFVLWKWRKPFWMDWNFKLVIDCWNIVLYQNSVHPYRYTFRQFVSYESGFWQFVCTKKLQSKYKDYKDYFEDSFWFRECPVDESWNYFLLRTSLLKSDESIADFVLSAVKYE